MLKFFFGFLLLILVGCTSVERKAAIEICKNETGISSPIERIANYDVWNNYFD